VKTVALLYEKVMVLIRVCWLYGVGRVRRTACPLLNSEKVKRVGVLDYKSTTNDSTSPAMDQSRPEPSNPVQSWSCPRNFWTGIGLILDADGLDWTWCGPIPHGVQG